MLHQQRAPTRVGLPPSHLVVVPLKLVQQSLTATQSCLYEHRAVAAAHGTLFVLRPASWTSSSFRLWICWKKTMSRSCSESHPLCLLLSTSAWLSEGVRCPSPRQPARGGGAQSQAERVRSDSSRPSQYSDASHEACEARRLRPSRQRFATFSRPCPPSSPHTRFSKCTGPT
jgi:hypothetical protein